MGTRNRVEEFRDRQGKSQGELAHAAGTSQARISQIERGESQPGVLLAQRIAKALYTTTDYLFPTNEEVA